MKSVLGILFATTGVLGLFGGYYGGAAVNFAIVLILALPSCAKDGNSSDGHAA